MFEDFLSVQKLLGLLVIGYLLGSIPFASLAARIRGVDIFTTGSAKAGAANVFWHIGHGTGALALAGEGGLEIYRDMTALLESLPRLDVVALHAFGARLGKSGADEAFRTASGLLRWWLARMILAAAGGGRQTVSAMTDAEQALMDRLGRAVGLDRWFEVWEKINRLLDKTDPINLNRKQVILNVFLTLENAVRP